MPMLATPADFDGEPPRPRFRAPHLGEHTRELLAELQVPANEIEALVDSGVALDGTSGGA
jgi:crotonobetainyl-CoA:carnitine CoA-transferase CaiB-like acyl-CoA transferase